MIWEHNMTPYINKALRPYNERLPYNSFATENGIMTPYINKAQAVMENGYTPTNTEAAEEAYRKKVMELGLTSPIDGPYKVLPEYIKEDVVNNVATKEMKNVKDNTKKIKDFISNNRSYWNDPRMAIARYEYVWKGNLAPFNTIVAEYEAHDKEERDRIAKANEAAAIRKEQVEQKEALAEQEKKEEIARLKDEYDKQYDITESSFKTYQLAKSGSNDTATAEAKIALDKEMKTLGRISDKLKKLGYDIDDVVFDIPTTPQAEPKQKENEYANIGTLLGFERTVTTADDLLENIKLMSKRSNTKENTETYTKAKKSLNELYSNTTDRDTKSKLEQAIKELDSKYAKKNRVYQPGQTVLSFKKPSLPVEKGYEWVREGNKMYPGKKFNWIVKRK